MTSELIQGHRLADPLGESEAAEADGTLKNFAKVGSSRPSSLLYTYGPGSVMDLPHFTVMPLGYDAWDRVWARRPFHRPVHAPRLLDSVRTLLGRQVDELRNFPWEEKVSTYSREGADLGVPAMVFPQWMRCTGCNMLAPIGSFSYTNTRMFRPDEAEFEHKECYGDPRPGAKKQKKALRRTAVAARYLLACEDGHLDEFPYDWWVHQGGTCPKVEVPRLKMIDRAGGAGASAIIKCMSCDASRAMNEAQGEVGRLKLPLCRGRHPHLEGFEPGGCNQETRLLLIGASNLWFPALQSIIDMPRLNPAERQRDLADAIRVALGENLAVYLGAPPQLARIALQEKIPGSDDLTDAELVELMKLAGQPVEESEEEHAERKAAWSPVDLLVPEWRYLLIEPASDFHEDVSSGLTLSPRRVSDQMPSGIQRVLAVDRLRKVNALVGFSRIDEMSRVNDVSTRLVRLSARAPKWVAATEDRGEGVFIQLDEDAVAAWETVVEHDPVFAAHREAHRRNFTNRFSSTAADVDPDDRLPPPRYWLMHTFAHLLIRTMAMSSGYGAASLSERIYAWKAEGERPAAAGVLICTTASDSDGTLGGLVRLSDPDELFRIVRDSLYRATRCSSDPICARRLPKQPEDFLHGAACHCCAMASETSCERANRFLDRRFVVELPGSDPALAFFRGVHDGG